MDLSSDYVSDIIDEIALEGLDGVTFQGLWLRLSQRPGFIFNPLDDHVKRFLWQIISKASCISFYKLASPREDLVIYSRTDYIDACGNIYEPEVMPDFIYPHAPVEDNGILGSCSTYKERVNITNEIRKENYETVTSRGNSLVMVANQSTRFRAICSLDFNPVTELGLTQYCLLERIGRSRYEGEATQGKRGLQIVTNDPKMLYYYMKFLVKNKLVVKQVFHMKVSKQTSTGSLIHLPRFYSEVKSRQDTDALRLIEYLNQAPLKCVPLKNLKSLLNIELKKLLMKYPKNFRAIQMPYRVLYPNSRPGDWKLKSSGAERSVRVLKLFDPNISKDEDEDDDDEEEVGLMDESQRRMDWSLMRQAYFFVEKAGPRGMKQATIGSLLGVPSLQARNICKHLVRKKVVKTSLIDIGRQRISHYYCSKFDSSESSLTSELLEEKNKLLESITINTTLRSESSPSKVSTSKERKKRASIGKECPEIVPEDPNLNKTAVDPAGEIEAEIIVGGKQLDQAGDKGLKEELKVLDLSDSSSGSAVTARMLKRANIIVQSVNTHRVIQDTQKMLRIISEVEESEGSKQIVDRKTIQRLLDKLESDGLLKIIKVILKGHGREKTMVFICHPSVNESHSEIQSAIEQAKMKLPIVSAHHTKKNMKKVQDAKKSKLPVLKHDVKLGRKYGYKPKCVRMRILHVYMYYLIYGYEGDPGLDQSCKEEIIRKEGVESSVSEEMSFVYRTELDWKMFLPPLPIHGEYVTGWCLLSDVLLRLPLCLFVCIVNVPYNIPGLMDYLTHPIKKFFLVKHLPPDILHYLTMMRKYIFLVSDIVARLGFIGLIQMGPQKLKEKDQVFIYLNKHALLFNTTTSDVGYNHISTDKTYECIKYTFNTIEDVEQYWYDLWNFAMNTSLGNRQSMTGQPIVIESVNTKKELLAAIQVKTVEEAAACDVGYLPGDNLGAAGLDSDMFVHLKRNWYWAGKKIEGTPEENIILYPPVMKPSRTLVKVFNTAKHGKAAKFKDKENVNQDKDKAPEAGGQMSRDKGSKLPSGWKSRAVSKKITRILRKRTSRYPRKPYYDQKDKDALSRMVKLRVDWSQAEDNLLLICKVASLYMSPVKRRHIAKNFCAVREILHSTYPDISRNKTSRACQRRMHYMLKNDFTARSVYMCLEEIKLDPEIHAKFHRAVEELDAVLKAQGEGPKGYQVEYDKIFMDLVSTLLRKLKTVTNIEKNCTDIKLPDTAAEFEKIYKPFIPTPMTAKCAMFKEVQKHLDILSSVINSVIHSSLCCVTEKTSYSNQLFYIYQQYPDKLLRHVMAKCRSLQIISCSKRFKRWKSMGYDCLPLASSPYQLSISYVHILQSKYQYSIFSECWNGFKSILSGSLCKSSMKHSPQTRIVKETHPNYVYTNVEVKCGGQCANIVELFSADLIELNVEFPDQLIVLDPRLSETEESYKLIMKRFKDMLAIIKGSNSDDEEEDEETEKEEKEPCFEQFNLKNKTGVANTASRLALYMMRDEPQEQLDNSLQHAHDFFVLNPCKVTVGLEKDKVEKAVTFKDLKNQVLAEIKRSATFPMEKRENDEILTSLGVNIDSFQRTVKLLLKYLESKCELGATYDELKEKFHENDDFIDAIFTLVENHFVLKTGVISPRFVHNKFSKAWLVKSFFLYRSQRESIGERANQSFAISFGEREGSKRKLTPTASKNPKRSVADTGSNKKKTPEIPVIGRPPKKKLKLESAIEIDELSSDSNDSLDDSLTDVAGPEYSSPALKKQKLDTSMKQNVFSEIQSPMKGTSSQIPVVERMEKEADPMVIPSSDSLTPSTSVENTNEVPRFIVKSTNRRWVTIPSENLKKINNFDPSEAKMVHVKVRPWIKIDGTLNRRVLDRLLGSVLGHCLTWPGIYVTKLQEKFTPALQPSHTYELLEILEKLKCVELMEMKKPFKSTLISKRSVATPVPVKGLGCITNIIVEPDPLAVSRLGYFIGDKSYSVDYLTHLSYKSKDGPIS